VASGVKEPLVPSRPQRDSGTDSGRELGREVSLEGGELKEEERERESSLGRKAPIPEVWRVPDNPQCLKWMSPYSACWLPELNSHAKQISGQKVAQGG
jgi:hypothetical protein